MPMQKDKACEGCSLYNLGKGFSQPEGICSNGVLLVGESLGYQEMLAGLPFRPDAQAGSALQRAINMLARSRSEFAFWNMIGCHPPGDQLGSTSYEYSSINHCRVHFDKVMDRYKPRVIVALGAVPFRHLVGQELSIQQVRGYVFRSSRYADILVVPTLHPSFVRRGNMKYLQLLLRDLDKAIKIAQGKKVEGKDFLLDPMNENWTLEPHGLEYVTRPNEEDAKYFLEQVEENPNLLIAYDIETEKSIGESEDELEEYGSKITLIQFSTSRDSGIALPFTEPFIEIASQILSSPNPKCGHNVWRFDNPILAKAGIRINGRVDDSMWLQHHYKADLPLGLQQVAEFFGFKFAWKHYAYGNLPFYGIADVDAVQHIMARLPQELKQRGLWGEYNQREGIYKGYEGLVYALNPILERVSDRGIPINRERQQEFSREIDEEKKRIEAELNPLIPEKLLKCQPKEGYVREPKEVIELRGQVEIRIGLGRELFPGFAYATRTPKNFAEYVELKAGLSLRTFKIAPPKPKKNSTPSFADQLAEIETNGHLVEVQRWCKILPFNPNSPDQISNYIKHIGDEAKAKKAMTRLSKEKPADIENGGSRKKNNLKTSAEVLKRLYAETGNRVYKLILEYKGLTKMQGTYCGGEYLPKDDDRIHTEFSFRPATLQLSSRKPNVQNSPQHSHLAQKFLRCFESRKGYSFIKCDMKSFHATMVGWLAEDKDYLRLCRLDIHSYVTAHMAMLPEKDTCIEWSDDELRVFLKGVKKKYEDLRNQAKRVILGIPYGLSEAGCYERFRDDFNPSAEVALRGKRRTLTGDMLQKEIQRIGKKRVKDLYNLLRKLFPKVFIWQSKVKQEAHEKGYLQSPFGARREFACVLDFKYTAGGREVLEQKNGEDAEKAASFYPQVNSFGHMREGMLILENKELLEKYGLINTVHDDLRFECKDELIEEALREVNEVLSRKSKVLVSEVMGPFYCEAEFKVGKNLADYNDDPGRGEINLEGLKEVKI